MTHPERTRRGGFTLLELLVVIMIMGVVMSLGTTTFISINSIWSERRAITELDNQAQAALESIRADLASAVAPSLSGAAFSSATREVKDDGIYPPAIYADDELSLAIEAGESGSVAKVGYRIERDGAKGHLVRTVGPVSAEFPGGGKAEIIPALVQGFSIEYLAPGPGAAWSETWAGPGLPSAVRVSIALESPTRREFQTCRKAVVPIHVK